MADVLKEIFGTINKRYRDMGDGSYAEVVALGSGVGGDGVNIGEVTLDNAREVKTATIANGASLSGAVDLGNNVLVGIVMPAAWTTATLSFQGSHDGTTYQELKDEYDTLLSYNPLVSSNRAVDPIHFLPWRYIKVRSGTAASAVNQGAAREINLVTRPV